GSLDSSWSSYLSDRIDEVVRQGALEVRLDLAGISYLSSNGIALLVRYQKQLRRIGGRVRIVAGSEGGSEGLRLSGVAPLFADDGPAEGRATAPAARCKVVERDRMTLQIFPAGGDGHIGRLDLCGDPARLRARGFDAQDERTWMAETGAAAFG